MASVRRDLCTPTRVYVETRYGEPAVAELKKLGAHWDKEARCWWVGAAKKKAVEDLLIDVDQKIDKDMEAGLTPAVKQKHPDQVKIYAKVVYKGRVYYKAAETRDGEKYLLVSLPMGTGTSEGYIEFWVKKEYCEVVKVYEPREVWDGRRYSGKTVTVQMTLGKLADFLNKQKNKEARQGRCSECDEWGPAGERCSECYEGNYM